MVFWRGDFFKKSLDNTSNTLSKLGNYAKDSLHKATANNDGGVPSRPVNPEPHTPPGTPPSTQPNTPRSNSNESTDPDYITNAVNQYKHQNNPQSIGGRRKRHTKRINSKKRSSRKSKKSKRTKRHRKYILKGGCTDCGGLKSPDYSTLANNAQPISGIRTAEPYGIYGQTPYPVWQYNK